MALHDLYAYGTRPFQAIPKDEGVQQQVSHYVADILHMT